MAFWAKDRGPSYEEPYYWAVGAGFYKGKYPPWHDVADSPFTKVLEDNYEAIKAEVLDFYEHRGDLLKPNWLQWGYTNEGWLTIDLYSFGMRTPSNCRELPVLDSVVRQLPGLMLAQVAVLQPHTTIRPHVGETSTVIRCHLPLVVPGSAPDLGMRVGAETRCWEEGKVWALNMVYRHYAWNNTDKARIVVVIDYINPDYSDRQREIEANCLALMAMKGLSNSFPVLKKAPSWVTTPARKALALAARPFLFLQRHIDFSFTKLYLRPPGRRHSPTGDSPQVSPIGSPVSSLPPSSDEPVSSSVNA